MGSGRKAVAKVDAIPPPSEHHPTDPAVEVARQGQRYILGRGRDFYAIWEWSAHGTPLATYPRTDGGWREAGLRFNALESALLAPRKPTPATRAPPRLPLLTRTVLVTAALAAVTLLAAVPLLNRAERPPSDQVFDEDFSDRTSGFPIYPFDGGRAGYVDGSYRILFDAPGGFISPVYPLREPIPVLELDVDMWIPEAPTGADPMAGLGCLVGQDDGYGVDLAPFGGGEVNVHFFRLVDRFPAEIWRASSDGFHVGSVLNHLSLACRAFSDGSVELRFAVNGNGIEPIRDDELHDQPGFVGVALDAVTDSAGTDVRFDNLVATRGGESTQP